MKCFVEGLIATLPPFPRPLKYNLWIEPPQIYLTPLLAPSQVHVYPLHDVVLFRVVGELLGRDFEDGGNGGGVGREDSTNVVGDVLIDKDNTNVLARR